MMVIIIYNNKSKREIVNISIKYMYESTNKDKNKFYNDSYWNISFKW